MSLECYNRGCNSKYTEEDNHDEACTHHPGLPYFHDAYKIWSCCQKKSIDFTQFLDIKGCTKSKHSNVKPEKPVKKEENIKVEEFNEITNKPIEVFERPSEDIPMGKLSYQIGSSLKPHLEQLEADQNGSTEEKDEVLTIGTMCKNSGCKTSYNGSSSQTICVYHTGVPIFHEGMKYWTCCQRKTSDFEAFLQQEGCTQGSHLWLKPKQTETNIDRSKTCRFDWFQTANDVVINVYSKMPIPSLSLIEANPVKINILVTFGEDKKEFYKEIVLNGSIDVEKSEINYLASKTEITLKKAPQIQWPRLELN